MRLRSSPTRRLYRHIPRPHSPVLAAPPEAPSKAPKQKKPGGGKKIGLIVGIAAAVVVLVVALVLLLGGKGGKDDPTLGRYEGVSCTIDGVEVGAEDEWIELKAKNKADVCIIGQEFSGMEAGR